jgi:anti-sigma regulatory factor (Ser/Thr protein kinase)
VELVVSELATNAVVHAQTPFLVTLQGDGGTLVLTVQDQAPSSRPRMWRSSPEATGGGGF